MAAQNGNLKHKYITVMQMLGTIPPLGCKQPLRIDVNESHYTCIHVHVHEYRKKNDKAMNTTQDLRQQKNLHGTQTHNLTCSMCDAVCTYTIELSRQLSSAG